MGLFPRQLSLTLRTLFSRLRVLGAERRLRKRSIIVATERIVDQVNPALRGYGNYRKRLSPVAERILDHSTALIQQVPGPVEIDPRNWMSDPFLSMLFPSQDTLRKALSGPEVRKWLRENDADDDADLVGLLLALPKERTRLGMELAGDQVQHDVKQTTLGFAELEVAAVGTDVDSLRAALVQPVTDVIVSLGIARLAAQEERIASLEDALRMLKLKLKVISPRVSGVDLMLAGSSQHLADYERLKGRIEETEHELASARQGLQDSDEYFARITELLDHPQKEIHLERQHIWLDRMNVIRDRQHPDAHEISFVRAVRTDQQGRIALFVRFPRSLIISADEQFAAVERHLGTG